METIFFDQHEVLVTNARFTVGNQTYAVRNITSVEVISFPAKRAFPMLLLLLGAALPAAGLCVRTEWAGWLSQVKSPLSVEHFSAIGVAVAALALVWLFSQSKKYAILLRTSGGEIRALESVRRKFIEAVLAAINQAIAS